MLNIKILIFFLVDLTKVMCRRSVLSRDIMLTFRLRVALDTSALVCVFLLFFSLVGLFCCERCCVWMNSCVELTELPKEIASKFYIPTETFVHP
jgi:hypothetical protein